METVKSERESVSLQETLLKQGEELLRAEANAISQLRSKLDQSFTAACQLILQCKGRIVITGMGKSGHIANKIAATFASTGTPALFVHPAEASHGDLGMITANDSVIAISNSGQTEELLTILPMIKRLQLPLIAITSNPQSNLARFANVHLDTHVKQEACPLRLAPTTSTTVSLALGDALAVAVLKAKGFSAEDFALSHPSGTLGRSLLFQIQDIMVSGDAVPIISHTATVAIALLEVSKKSLGMTAIVDDNDQLVGLFTDGDLRRTIDQGLDIHNTIITAVMTSPCRALSPTTLAAEAIQLMEQKRLNGFIVVDAANKPIGAFNIHQLLQARVI